MDWARFEIISGMLDALLILMGVVLMVQFRVIKKTLRKQRVAALHKQEETTGTFSDFPAPVFSSSMNRSAATGSYPSRNQDWKEEREQEQKRFDAVVREAEQMRSELSILFYDVQRFLDDLTPIVRASPQNSPHSGLPDQSLSSPPASPFSEEPLKDRVFRMAREGRSVSEIASVVGRGEGEVAFLLAMEKVGSS